MLHDAVLLISDFFPRDWVFFALDILVGAMGYLVIRLVGRVDTLEERAESHGSEIRDTRAAIAYVYGKLNLPPFPYTAEWRHKD